MSQIENYWLTLIPRLELGIRRVDHASVLAEIRSLELSKIPRSIRADLAEIARRASDALLALKILNPIIYPKQKDVTPATDREKIVYASALPVVGLNEEALLILEKINPESHPQALLYSSFALFGMWNYKKAIPLLKQYIKSPKLNPYQKLVGQVNLIAAYVSNSNFDQAESLIKRSLKQAKQEQNLLLFGNILELRSQILIQEEKYQEALTTLQESANVLKATGGLYYDLVKKWQAICHLMIAPNNSQHLKNLQTIQEEAIENSYWEIVRDCAFYLGYATHDHQRLEQVVNGTPYPQFKQKAIRLTGIKPSTSGHKYVRSLSNLKSNLDIRTPALLSTPTLARTLEVLSLDYFKPVSLGALFRELYPGEVFNPFTSPKRVFNTVYRLRKWLNDNHWPIQIIVKNLEFRLSGEGNLTLYRRNLPKEIALLYQFNETRKPKSFSRKDLADVLKVSQRYANKILSQAVTKRIISCSGKGRAIKYKFANNWNRET